MNQIETLINVLLVEDNPDDVFLMRRALRKGGIPLPLQVVTDGKQAISYLEGAGRYNDRHAFPIPDLIFLDLKLPFMHGFMVLAWMKKQVHLDATRVVILTSSMEDQDRDKAEALGLLYLVKPPTPEMVLKAASLLDRTQERVS